MHAFTGCDSVSAFSAKGKLIVLKLGTRYVTLQDPLRKHCERANYQSAIWHRSLQSSPQIPLPIGSGLCLKDGKLNIDWMSGEPAPKAVFELLSCQCKRVCQLPSCTCLANGLYWIDMCQLQECTNQPEELQRI